MSGDMTKQQGSDFGYCVTFTKGLHLWYQVLIKLTNTIFFINFSFT